jgi:hypothetical protein
MRIKVLSTPNSSSRERTRCRSAAWRVLVVLGGTALVLAVPGARLVADQIELRNGDRYSGTVLSVDTNAVVLRSEVLGKITVPRSQVASLTIGTPAKTNTARVRPVSTNHLARLLATTSSGTNSDFAAMLRQLGADTNSAEQVRSQFLGGAGVEANQKFDQMLGELTTGKMTLNDLRAQAKAAADQVRSQRGDLGGDLGSLLDSYLAVLDNFLDETAPPTTNSAPRPTKR